MGVCEKMIDKNKTAEDIEEIQRIIYRNTNNKIKDKRIAANSKLVHLLDRVINMLVITLLILFITIPIISYKWEFATNNYFWGVENKTCAAVILHNWYGHSINEGLTRYGIYSDNVSAILLIILLVALIINLVSQITCKNKLYKSLISSYSMACNIVILIYVRYILKVGYFAGTVYNETISICYGYYVILAVCLASMILAIGRYKITIKLEDTDIGRVIYKMVSRLGFR